MSNLLPILNLHHEILHAMILFNAVAVAGIARRATGDLHVLLFTPPDQPMAFEREIAVLILKHNAAVTSQVDENGCTRRVLSVPQ